MKKTPQDIIGDIAILKFPFNISLREKKKLSQELLKKHKNIKTILEKSEKIKGRLRKAKTKFLAGENKKETIHNENNCRFFLNIDETYFSPRLSNERKLVSEDIFKNLNLKSSRSKRGRKIKILVMFAGVGVFPVVIARKLKQEIKKKANFEAEIISSELNKKASKFAEKNVELNKLGDFVRVIQGDSKKLPEKLGKNYKADFIIMPRPNLKETFLKTALKLSKKGTKIYYYGFGSRENVLGEITNSVKQSSLRKEISRVKIRKAGEIAPYKFRWLAEFCVK